MQAPIGGASTPKLAAAVSNAGALGTLSIAWRTVPEVTSLLHRLDYVDGSVRDLEEKKEKRRLRKSLRKMERTSGGVF